MSADNEIHGDAAVPVRIAEAVTRLADELPVAGLGTPHTHGSPSDADSREAFAAYGKAGLIGLHWPTRFGGSDLSPLVTLAVEELLGYHWLPLSSYLLSVKTIGNAMLQFATEDLCARLLPSIVAGETIFCQGFSEPEAGTDLGAIRTTAHRDGGSYVVRGRKIWTSSAEIADWVYLAVRTGSLESRHRGLSVLVADIDTPGITVDIHRTLGGGTLGELTLDDVVVPADQLIGKENGGWQVLMGTLDYERVTSEKVGVVARILDDLEPFVDAAGRRLLDRLKGATDVARLHGRRATERLAAGEDASAESSMAKLSVALLMQEVAAAAVDLLGPRAHIESGHGAVLDGRIAAFSRAVVAATIAGGVSDIQRKNIIRKRVGVAS